jgi:hypothetical protein
MTKTIYFKNEKPWTGVDQAKEETDPELYSMLKEFLHIYFCSNNDEEERQWSTSIENGYTKKIEETHGYRPQT